MALSLQLVRVCVGVKFYHTHTLTSFGRILMSEEAEILNVENEKNTVLGWGAENRGRQNS